MIQYYEGEGFLSKACLSCLHNGACCWNAIIFRVSLKLSYVHGVLLVSRCLIDQVEMPSCLT